jgi:hypothetical protein
VIQVYLRNIARVRYGVNGIIIGRLPPDARVISMKVFLGDGDPPLCSGSLAPATFPTLGRVRPNMTEQAALTRVNIGQQTLIVVQGGLSFEWAGGWVSKGEAILGFDKK